jgi:hypothetical protein
MGAQSFFGGLLGGVGQGVLQREQMDYAQKMKDTEARRQAMEMLVQSGALNEEQQALAVKALITPTLQNPSIMAKFVGGLKKTLKGGKPQTPEAGAFDPLFAAFEPLGRPPQQTANAAPQTETVRAENIVPSSTTIQPVPQPRTMRQKWADEASQREINRFRQQAEIETQQTGAKQHQLIQAKLDEIDKAEARKLISPEQARVQRNAALGGPSPYQSMRPLFGVNTPGNALPVNAVDSEGKVIPKELRNPDHIFKPVSAGFDEEGKPQYVWLETRMSGGASTSQFQQWMDATKAKKGASLTPDEAQRAIEQYSRMHRPSIGEVYGRTEATEKAKIDINQQYPQLTTAGQSALTNVEPTIGQIDDLLAKLEQPDENGVPLKENNSNLYFTANRAKYALGIAPEEAELAGQIANLELVKITGAMPYATRSRNFQYIKQIQLHLPNAWVDSPKNVYQKLKVAKANMERIREDVLANDVKGKVVNGLTNVPRPSSSATPKVSKRVKFEDLPE